MLLVTPAELIDVDFIKRKHRNSKNVRYEEQDSGSVLPAKKTEVTTGP